jgi:hypothetical protein
LGEKHLSSVSHDGGKILVTPIHTRDRFVASVIHVIDQSPTSASYVVDVQPTTASHVGGIDSIEKPRWIGSKPKFPCNIFSGDNLTHLGPGLLEAWRLWSLSISAYDSYSYEVSSQPIEPLVDELVTVMQSSIEPTPLLGG